MNDAINFTPIVDNFVFMILKYLKFEDEFDLRRGELVTPIKNTHK